MDDNDELRADGRRPKEVSAQIKNLSKSVLSWNGEGLFLLSNVQCCFDEKCQDRHLIYDRHLILMQIRDLQCELGVVPKADG